MSPTDLERLARDHAPFLRRLAVALLGDASAAEDVVQETWLAAARSQESVLRSPRAWLARTVRNLASSEHRRRARRAEATLEHDVPVGQGAADVAASLDAERALVEALGALEEPFRTAVYLRYREGLRLREIADRTGAPINTVRSRLQRGLARLRERLDDALGGPERRRAALLPFAIAARPKGLLAPLVAMKKLSLAAVAVLIVVGAAALRSAFGGGAATPVGDVERLVLSDPEASKTSPDPSVEPVREPLPGPEDPAARSASPAGSELLVRVLDEAGAPAPDVSVLLDGREVAARYFPPCTIVSDGAGTALFQGLERGTYIVQGAGSGARVTVQADGSSNVEVTLTLTRTARFRGCVRDDDGNAVPGAVLLTPPLASTGPVLRLGAADAEGRFEVQVASRAKVVAMAPGFIATQPVSVRSLDQPEPGVFEGDIAVRRVEGRLAGQVVDEAGEPIVDALVRADVDVDPAPYGSHGVSTAVRSGPDGRFAFEVSLDVGERVQVAAFAVGFAPGSATVTVGASSDDTTIVLGPGRRVSGTAALEDGTPAANAAIEASLGSMHWMGDLRSGVWHPVLRADAEGRFVLEDAPRDAFSLVATHRVDDVGRVQRGALVLGAGDDESVDVELDLSSRPSIHGRVVDESGAPLPGVNVDAVNEGGGNGRQHRFGGTTDAQGRFELTSLVQLPECGDGPAWALEVKKFGESGVTELARVGGLVPSGEEVLVTVVGAHAAPDAWIQGVLLGADGGPPPARATLFVQFDSQVLHPVDLDPASGSFRAGPYRPGSAKVYLALGDGLETLRDGLELEPGATLDLGSVRIGGGGHIALAPRLETDVDVPPGALEGLYRDQRITAQNAAGSTVHLSWSEALWRTESPVQPGRWTLRHKGGEKLAVDGAVVDVVDGETADVEARARLGRPLRLDAQFDAGAEWASLVLVSEELTDAPLGWSRTSRSLVPADIERFGLRIVAPCGARSRITVRTDTGLEGSVEVDVPGFMDSFAPVEIEVR